MPANSSKQEAVLITLFLWYFPLKWHVNEVGATYVHIFSSSTRFEAGGALFKEMHVPYIKGN